jgi:hypothetical protein
MASTFTANKLNLEEPGSGDYAGTWNTPVNSNFTLIDAACGGVVTKSLAGGDTTLSTAEAANMRVAVTGTLTANRSIILPATRGGFWLITNGTSGAFTVTVKTAAGGSTGVTVEQGYTTLVFSDGTNGYYGDNGPLSKYLPLAGGTMTGALALPSNGLNVGSGQLQVTGGNITASGNITATGNVTAYSDRRWKTDISQLSGALELVKKLKGVRYKMFGNDCVGLIAQDVEEVIPQVVFQDQDGMRHLAYQNLVAVLIEAVKELSDKVESLEAGK